MKILSLLDIKQALWDERFRKLFPEHDKEITEFLNNPGCACNTELYQKLMGYKDRLQEYFPTKLIITPKEEAESLSRNHWKVINCHVDKLQSELKKLGKGRKQIAVARYQDQVTVIVNELEVLF